MRDSRAGGHNTHMSLTLSLFLALVPPNTPVSEKYEMCIAQAVACTDEIGKAYDNEPPEIAVNGCIAQYEDCSYDFEDAHTDNCRQAYAWCVLEQWTSEETYLKFCAEVFVVCPSP